MGKRRGMHHGSATAGRAPDRSRIQQVIAVEPVITDDIVTQVPQVSRYMGAYVTVMPRDQNPLLSWIRLFLTVQLSLLASISIP